MFPSPFDYVAAGSVEEAVAAKAEGGDDTRFLAGGQSLIPMMKMRLAHPAKLVDINRHPRARHARAGQRSPAGRRARAPRRHRARPTCTFGAIASAAPWISDPLVRNRGTLCGSVAHCDPEGDWNSVLLATGADVIARGPNGERTIPITEFIVDFFTNALADDEMVTEVRIPVPAGRAGGSYQKLERKVGDYATVAVAAHLELGGRRHDRDARGSRSPRSCPVNTKVDRGRGSARRAAAERRAVRRGGRARGAGVASRATTCGARPSGSATSCACSRAGRSRPRREQAAGEQ